MHVLKVVLVLELLLEVLLHHGEGRVGCAAGELLVVHQLSLGLKELVTVLAAVLALLCNTQGLGTGTPLQLSLISNHHPIRSWMVVWLTNCSSIKKFKKREEPQRKEGYLRMLYYNALMPC